MNFILLNSCILREVYSLNTLDIQIQYMQELLEPSPIMLQ